MSVEREAVSKEEIEETGRTYNYRQELYKNYGYDNEQERLFIMNAALPITGNILEAGTGKGHLALTLAKKGYSLITYDIDPVVQRIAFLNLMYFGLDNKVKLVTENGNRLSFADKSFDVLFCVNALHHMKEPGAVFDEFLRVLSDRGKIVLSDFTEKGFMIMSAVHEREGGKHEVIGWNMDKAAVFFRDRNCKINEVSDECQRVLVIRRGA